MSALGLSGIHLNWRYLFKRLLAAVFCFWACFAVLCFVYPIQERMRSFHYSLSQVLPEYLLMSFIVTCIVVFVVPLLSWWCNKLVIWMSVIIRTVATFVLLWVFAMSLDSRGLKDYWPPSQIMSFFTELRVIVFAYEYTPIVSLVAGVYYSFTGSRKSTPTPNAERYAQRGQARERNRDG